MPQKSGFDSLVRHFQDQGGIVSSKAKIVIACLVCLVIGYFAGREHLKYEMRTAMQDAVKAIQSGLSSMFDDASDSKPSEYKPPKAKTEDQPLTVALLKKGFSPSDPYDGKYEEEITFTLQFANKTGKDIRAFDGVIEFTDLLGNSILASKVEINERVAQGSSLDWEGALKYNQFMKDRKRLRSEPKENLKISFRANKVLFADNTTKEYE